MPALKVTASGSLYLIGELDHSGTPTDLYKIGIVRDNESARSTEDRLNEHQTGNPRRLYVAYEAATEVVERVETYLHARFAPYRVGGEWFSLAGDLLEAVIAEVNHQVSEVQTVVQSAMRVAELAEAVSNGKLRGATDESVELHLELTRIRKMLSACESSLSHLVNELTIAQEREHSDRRWVQIEEKVGPRTFNKSKFEMAHPRIFASYLEKKRRKSRTFRLVAESGCSTQMGSMEQQIYDHLAKVNSSNTANTDGSCLHKLFLETLSYQSPLLWKAEVYETKLREHCGPFDGIENICSWKRFETNSVVLNTDRLKKERPAMYTRFVVDSPTTLVRIPVRDLGFRF